MLRIRAGEKIVIGYDLDDKFSRISFCIADGEVETLSPVAGTEIYNIPTVLCKREGANQWFYGREALHYAEENQGIIIENLLQLALDGETLQIEGRAYEPIALLTLFVRRTLGMLTQKNCSIEDIVAITFTIRNLESKTLEVLQQMAAGLKIKTKKIRYQSYAESFYHYMIQQPEDLWVQDVILCEYEKNKIFVSRMSCNRRTTPCVVFVDKKEYDFPSYESISESEHIRQEKYRSMDQKFLNLMKDVCENSYISSVYLIGEEFSQDWLKESLRYLCTGRRVFQGSNLYSKGACYGIRAELKAGELQKDYVFLGKDKLKANVGMNVLRKGEKSYYALLDAGTDCFSAECTMECYVQDDNTIEFVIAPLIAKKGKIAEILLNDLPGKMSRIKIHVCLQGLDKLMVEIKDMGLGEIRPPSGLEWKEEIALYD